MGDGVLAYFGWPQAHEDEAERAVRAGLAIIEAVGRAGRRPAGEPLAARVGIATGLVVVGDLVGEGAARRRRWSARRPNLAARLQALAEPGSVVDRRGDAPAARRPVRAAPTSAPRRLKGFAEPRARLRVAGEGAAEGRFEALHGERSRRWSGASTSSALLLDRWERAKDGEGQVVLLAGEPGIGKSRLVRALRERLARRAAHAAQPLLLALPPTARSTR